MENYIWKQIHINDIIQRSECMKSSNKVFSIEAQLQELKVEVSNIFTELKSIYNFYTYNAEKISTMGLLKMINDVNLIEKENDMESIKQILIAINRNEVNSDYKKMKSKHKNEVKILSTLPLIYVHFPKFVEILIRLAEYKIENKFIHEKFFDFWYTYIKDKTCISHQFDIINSIYTPEVQEVINSNISKYQIIYVRFFLTISNKKYSDIKSFINILELEISTDIIHSILNHIVKDSFMINIVEFTHIIVCLASIWDANPFLNIKEKIKNFTAHMFCKFAYLMNM